MSGYLDHDFVLGSGAEVSPARPSLDSTKKVPAQQGRPPGGTKKEERTSPPAEMPDFFRGVLGEIVQTAAPTTEAAPVGILVSLLAGVGVIAGQRPYVQVGNTRHPLLIWPLLFGRTGSGRKGEAGETARLFLLSSYSQLPDLAVTGLSSGEGLIERIRDTANEDDRGGTEDKRLLVTEPEFSSVMARSKREGSTLAPVLRQAWDGRALSVLNRSALAASASHVGIVGHITPREFRLRLAETEMAGGTYNRFLPIYVERPHRLALPTGLGEETVATLGKKLREAIDHASKHGRVRLDQAATRLWCNGLYDELTAVDDEDAVWVEFAQRAAPTVCASPGCMPCWTTVTTSTATTWPPPRRWCVTRSTAPSTCWIASPGILGSTVFAARSTRPGRMGSPAARSARCSPATCPRPCWTNCSPLSPSPASTKRSRRTAPAAVALSATAKHEQTPTMPATTMTKEHKMAETRHTELHNRRSVAPPTEPDGQGWPAVEATEAEYDEHTFVADVDDDALGVTSERWVAQVVRRIPADSPYWDRLRWERELAEEDKEGEEHD